MRFVKRFRVMISERLKKLLEAQPLGKLPAMLALLSLTVLISGCPSRKEVDAELWLNTGLPPEICAAHPEILKHFGIYRLLDSGEKELLSYCTVIKDADGKPAFAIQGYTSINTNKLKKFLDALLPAQVTMP